MSSKLVAISVSAAAFVLLTQAAKGFSTGPPIFSTGVPEDGGQTCVRCHVSFALNSPGGSITVETGNYKPGQKQTIRVTVFHPDAQRWGFQITARRATNHLQKAGNFVLNTDYRVRCAPDGRDDTTDQPCTADQVEFVEHTAALTRTGANGTKTFEIDWIAPSTDTGDVVFYASGNAANNDGTPLGDHIYNNAAAPLVISADVCPSGLAPTVTGVSNAASGSRECAMNTLISIYGSGFASDTTRQSAVPDIRGGGGFAKQLACVSVEVGGQTVPITYVQANQINAQVPTSVGTGSIPYRVLVNGVASAQGTLTVNNYAPALFPFGTSKSVAAVATDGTALTNPDVLAGARPARPGEVIQLYATGLGATDPVWQAGEVPNAATRLRDPVSVTIGGTTLSAADITYAGVAPGFISGLYQLNVKVPASLADGNAAIQIAIGGVSSPSGMILPVKR